jgi:hypothetical protein
MLHAHPPVVGEILLIKDPTRPDVIRADRLKRSPVDSDMALIEQAVGLAQARPVEIALRIERSFEKRGCMLSVM